MNTINILRNAILAIVCFISSLALSAQQVTITGSTGADGSYTTLKLAFDAINANATQTGNNITVAINLSTDETLGGTAALNAGDWASLKIYPTAAGLSISGNLEAPIIELNGADNVTIDGRVNQAGTAADLTIVNNNTELIDVHNSAIRLVNDATHNLVQYCNLKGAASNPSTGTVEVSTASAGGNDDNTFTKNNFTSASPGYSSFNAFFSQGTAGNENDNLVISDNHFFDLLNQSNNTAGVLLRANTRNSVVSGNSFYETTAFTITSGALSYCAVRIMDNLGGITISNNYIGGSAPECGGTPLTSSSPAGIHILYVFEISARTGTGVSIQGNTIKNINWTSAASASYCIRLLAGKINVGTITPNSIGSDTGTGSISFTGTTNCTFYGISIANATTVVDCRNNKIGSITLANTSATAYTHFYGINANTTSTKTIINNLIGSTTEANSIHVTSTSTGNAQYVHGINLSGTGAETVTGNTIANLTNGTTNTNVATAGSVYGIYSSGGAATVSGNSIYNLTIANANNSATHTQSVAGIVFGTANVIRTVSGNTIYNLSNTYASFTGTVSGIYFRGSTIDNLVSKNNIHSLSVGSGSATASVFGIKAVDGTTTYANNMIALGGTSLANIYGIYDTGSQTFNLYNNSVYIGGAPASGTNTSYALYSNALTNTRDIRNNIFVNARNTSGGSNLHYAAYLNYTTTGTLTLDYNDYYVSGTGGTLGYYNSANRADLAAFKTATGKDANSVSGDPQFIDPTSASPNLHIHATTPTIIEGRGTPLGSVTDDYDGQTRATFTPTDMGADAGDFVALALPPVTIAGSTGADGSYTTLKLAFDAINANATQTGNNITVAINLSTDETAGGTATLNAGNWTSLKIYPTASGLIITGNLAAPLINLNGADKVTIDGSLNGSGSTADLTISNTHVGISTSTIRFIADASYNVVKYCNLLGSTTDLGVVCISTGTATGNVNNTIDHNNITNAGGNRPINGIYSWGTSAAVSNDMIITNNNVYDVFHPTSWTSGIYLGPNTKSSTISGNNIYETTVTPTNTCYHTGSYKLPKPFRYCRLECYANLRGTQECGVGAK
jgi:hypothetical protein